MAKGQPREPAAGISCRPRGRRGFHTPAGRPRRFDQLSRNDGRVAANAGRSDRRVDRRDGSELCGSRRTRRQRVTLYRRADFVFRAPARELLRHCVGERGRFWRAHRGSRSLSDLRRCRNQTQRRHSPNSVRHGRLRSRIGWHRRVGRVDRGGPGRGPVGMGAVRPARRRGGGRGVVRVSSGFWVARTHPDRRIFLGPAE